MQDLTDSEPAAVAVFAATARASSIRLTRVSPGLPEPVQRHESRDAREIATRYQPELSVPVTSWKA